MKYSVFSLLKNSLSGHKNWTPAWRSPEPKKEYDIIIVGGGGHGLATAYYLAKEHGLKNIAVLEKNYIVLAMWAATRRSFARIISCLAITHSTSYR